MKRTAYAVLVVLGLATAVNAQVGPGSLGIYADPGGTVSCANLPPFTATVLYVVATTSGLTSAGLAGAEFRVEVTNPTGWYLSYSYSPPSGGIVLGSPLDTDPDPDAGGGVTIGFSSCEPPSSTGKITFGTITVFNTGTGSSTSLVVRRHSTPTNPTYPCPLFVACDAPVFTKYCTMPAAAGGCSTLTVPKILPSTAGDPVVATFTLSPDAIPVPTGTAFTEMIDLSGSELWVMGQQITTPSVQFAFDGSLLRIGGVVVPLTPETPVLSDERLMQTFGSVPYVTQKIADGIPVATAVTLFEAECHAITKRIVEAVKRGDTMAARRVLERSALVESFQIAGDGSSYSARYRGLVIDHVVNGDLRASAGPVAEKPLAQVAHGYLTTLENAAARGQLIMVTAGAVFAWGGEAEMAVVRAQIGHVLAGGSLETVPPGPLDPKLFHNQGPLGELIAAARKAEK